MFTGIVREIGRISARRDGDEGVSFTIETDSISQALSLGDSVAVSGTCLTVTELGEGQFGVDAVPATIDRTTLGSWAVGDMVNLEPALQAGEPLGGHLVQGHIDAVGHVVALEARRETAILDVELPAEVAALTVSQGSLTIDGVSLTVNRLEGAVARFAIIPYTWSHTTLRSLRAGASVNVEADMIGKYVARMIGPYSRPPNP